MLRLLCVLELMLTLLSSEQTPKYCNKKTSAEVMLCISSADVFYACLNLRFLVAVSFIRNEHTSIEIFVWAYKRDYSIPKADLSLLSILFRFFSTALSVKPSRSAVCLYVFLSVVSNLSKFIPPVSSSNRFSIGDSF